ncbi:hypothetical protein BH10PLA2_BH10PLA2_27100 [soil metagenome]
MKFLAWRVAAGPASNAGLFHYSLAVGFRPPPWGSRQETSVTQASLSLSLGYLRPPPWGSGWQNFFEPPEEITTKSSRCFH